ncbi:MAG: hypothetical protein KBD64_02755 [Gammaproteobacteria bacterium]|nr:hypothetical protein [Gammaproteobacteria bacterium]
MSSNKTILEKHTEAKKNLEGLYFRFLASQDQVKTNPDNKEFKQDFREAKQDLLEFIRTKISIFTDMIKTDGQFNKHPYFRDILESDSNFIPVIDRDHSSQRPKN